MRVDELKIGDCFNWSDIYFIVLDEWSGQELEVRRVGCLDERSFGYPSTEVILVSEQEFMVEELKVDELRRKENADTRK